MNTRTLFLGLALGVSTILVLGQVTRPPTGGGTVSSTTIIATATNLPNLTVTNALAALGNASVATNLVVGKTNFVMGLNTDASNFKRGAFYHDGTDAVIAAQSAGAGGADQTLRILTQGAGAFIVDNPSTVAGNARGANAVDLQTSRVIATQVASGANSVMIGGRDSTASGAESIAGGASALATAQSSVALGSTVTAAGGYSSVGGLQAVAVLHGQKVYGSGRFSANGDAQTSELRARTVTTGATPANLTLSGAALSAVTALLVPANSTCAFDILVAARSTDAGTGDEESAGYKVTGLIERDNTAAATRIVGTPTVTVLAEDDAAWDFTVSADTTLGALNLIATGNNETAVRWVATVTLTQVGG